MTTATYPSGEPRQQQAKSDTDSIQRLGSYSRQKEVLWMRTRADGQDLSGHLASPRLEDRCEGC